VELDERRFERLRQDARLDSVDLARELPPPTAALYSLLQAVQETTARLYGLTTEQTDMEAAMETAAEREIELALIDDQIDETLAALSARIGLETVPKLMLWLQTVSRDRSASQFELLTLPLEDIQSGDDVQPAIDQFRRLLPELTEVLIDRRDRARAQRLHKLRCDGSDVVAVIGAGRHNGIQRRLDALETQAAEPDVAVPIRSAPLDVTTIPSTDPSDRTTLVRLPERVVSAAHNKAGSVFRR
jgi:pheromone shutdown protein TraB